MGNNSSDNKKSSSPMSCPSKKPQRQMQQQQYVQSSYNSYSQRGKQVDLSNVEYNDDEELNLKEAAKKTTTTDKPQINLDDLVSLRLKLKRPTIKASSFVDNTLPMLVTLKTDQLKDKQKIPIDLVCVIDTSGSMSGQKIQLVKDTFEYLMEYLDDSDRLSIVDFNSSAKRLTPLLRMNQENKTRTLSAVEAISAGGGTNINLGMNHAFQVLKQRREVNQMTGIFLLSDGLDGGAEQRVKASIDELNMKDNFTMHTFGYGNDHDPKLMTGIADLADGNFYFVEELNTVDECFVDCLGGLISSIAKDVEIQIKSNGDSFLKGLDVVKAYGDSKMWAKVGDTYVTKISQLISGKEKDYVLDVKIPKYAGEIKDEQKNAIIAEAKATMKTLEGKEFVVKGELKVTIVNETEEIQEEEDDKDVMKNFYRVKGAEVLEKAKELADNRKYEDAQKLLKDLKEELANSALKDEQFIKNIITDIDQAYENAKPEVYEAYGKVRMMENARAQYQQKTNLKSANLFSNSTQQEMVFKAKSRKK